MHKPNQARRPMAAAVFLGATLAALGPSSASADTGRESLGGVVNDLGRYCTTCWRNARVPGDLWGDCTQDVFQRLLERVPTNTWEHVLVEDTEERREFMRAIDTVKKRVRRAHKYAGAVDTVADWREDRRRQRADDRESVRLLAAELLSDRQCEILQQSFDGWSVNDIAANLKMSAARVSDEKYKAIRKLRGALDEARV